MISWLFKSCLKTRTYMSNSAPQPTRTWAGGFRSSRKTVVQELIRLISDHENVFEISVNGVGSDGGLVDKILGGVGGWGTLNNVMTTFKNIAKHYKPGDRIILNGYSRGAWAARHLALIIDQLGLPKDADDELFHHLYNCNDALLNTGVAEELLKGKECWQNVKIDALCCFDTVGSLGLPSTGLAKPLAILCGRKKKRDIVSNVALNVRFAFHCLSLHETREPYTPTLMSGQNVHQVFFPGSHGNMGWIEQKQSLVYGHFAWMIQQLHTHLGISFDEEKLAARFPSYRREGDGTCSATRWHNGHIDHINSGLLAVIGNKDREPGYICPKDSGIDLKIHIGARLRNHIDGIRAVPGFIFTVPPIGRHYWALCLQQSRWRRHSSSSESLKSERSNPTIADRIEEAPVGALEAKLLGLPQEVVTSL